MLSRNTYILISCAVIIVYGFCHQLQLLKHYSYQLQRNHTYHHYTHTNATATFLTVPPSTTTTSTATSPYRKWAYAFLVGGCDPYTKPQYRGFIYNVVVAAQRLQTLGSLADAIVMVQMSYSTNDTTLPQDDITLLQSVGVQIHYLPKFVSEVHEKFYALVMEKFRILQLTNYSRVMFLDSDILPLCPLDYLFELSEPQTTTITSPAKSNNIMVLKENIVFGWKGEPAHAGCFILKPNLADFEKLQTVIFKKEQQALTLPWPHWDPIFGWGHAIDSTDAWKSPNGLTGTNWTWHAVFADQGLLYYWTKYVQQQVSLIIGNQVENWGRNNDGKPILEHTYQRSTILMNATKQKVFGGCRSPITGRYLPDTLPYRDIEHFTGRGKPWESKWSYINQQLSMNSTNGGEGEVLATQPSTQLWFQTLKIASENANIRLNFSFVPTETIMNNNNNAGEPPVGRFSGYRAMIPHIRAKAERNWTAYQ